MQAERFEKVSEFEWRVPPSGAMRVPAVIYADENLIRAMDEKVYEQVTNVATLPGIVEASYAMPDAHWGYGFPIGGVAAFDAEQGGVVSAGGVGFDISCGVRTLLTGLTRTQLEGHESPLADGLYSHIPVGLGSRGQISLDAKEMDAMLTGGARWAVERGYGSPEDLERVEEHGCMAGARPECVSERAKNRQRREMGTLGSGNHYLEVQQVVELFDEATAAVFGVQRGAVVVSIHCGSRGLGHQIGTEFLRDMAAGAPGQGITLPDRELACARIESELGQRYLGAMRAGINCALANRQIITHLTREVFARIFPQAGLTLLYDVSHNTCKREEHTVDGRSRPLFVHRKGATRAFGPGHPALPEDLSETGQPVLIGGSMGTSSYILTGTEVSETRAFSSACHGAGRAMSRHAARRRWRGRQLVDELAQRNILIRSPSSRGVAEEAPGAYKDVGAVVEAAEHAGLARRVARLEPVVCIKG
ncbi:MAG: RNA-splicing ligase RtcB [Gammaproteobacteria bacterium]|nr:RtcB family protein [Gammaproteobacteria bacterium]NIP90161.1 RtcB family protein [Gammaproteobacteria bacterium]NIR24953.1 RtcB family protein [Gammaproteobacteria bacterium]NIS06621.1 RtcB family protein [Gammaproteobacteria bacterium]NIU40439.1 RNA-splicing ligase RtcB [Gammaproteobacteria bacterium]